MKTIILIAIANILSISTWAQNNISSRPSVSFSFGFVTPQFFGGEELVSSFNLRREELSYFKNENGERQSVGNYGPNTGFTLGIAYYLPLPNVKGLNIGLLVNSGQTGSSPSSDGYSEGYFFNFLNFGAGVQYYPKEDSKLYVKAEVGMGSVFTKNRFVNSSGSQDFLHHFGIGIESGVGIGYTLTPFKSEVLGINLEVQYQFYSTRVEVSNIGDDIWRFGALSIGTGLQF